MIANDSQERWITAALHARGGPHGRVAGFFGAIRDFPEIVAVAAEFELLQGGDRDTVRTL